MALVQALPLTVTDHPSPGVEVQQCRPRLTHSPSGPSSAPCVPCTSGTAMGSVSSLISGRTYHEKHCRAASEFITKPRRSTPATSCFRLQDNTLRSGSSLEQLLIISNPTQPQAQILPPPLPTKKQPQSTKVVGAVGGSTKGNFGYVNDKAVVGDWNDNSVVAATISPCSDSEDQRDNKTLNGNIGGPPPKLIPVSGQLEKVRENVLKSYFWPGYFPSQICSYISLKPIFLLISNQLFRQKIFHKYTARSLNTRANTGFLCRHIFEQITLTL